jgi:hypothetical protein
MLVSLRRSTSIIAVRNSRGPNCDTVHYLVKTVVREIVVGIQRMKGMNPKKWDLHGKRR